MKAHNLPAGKGKVIGICHYKIGKTDGVSLEIAKREKMLRQEMGHKVILIAGTSGLNGQEENGREIKLIPELDFDYPRGHRVIDTDINIENIKRNAFSGFELKPEQTYKTETALFYDIDRVAGRIIDRYFQMFGKSDLDYLFLHNIFSHGRHIAAAKAFYTIVKQINAKIIAVNHDFYEDYEGRYSARNNSKKIHAFLDNYVPPSLHGIKHVTINSIKKEQLTKKLDQKGAKPDTEIIVFPDTFDFDQDPWKADDHNKDFRQTFNIRSNDLFVLQATRIVKRKAIELAIDLIAELNRRKNELINRKLYNNKIFTVSSEIILAFAQAEEQDAVQYKEDLISRMDEKGVQYRFLYDRIESNRGYRDEKTIYSLWDAYVFADVVSYTSIWEGFGNQFLEAVFARKPIILYEYPVFMADIRKGRYHYISLGCKKTSLANELASIPVDHLKKAATSAIEMLTNPRTQQLLDHNFSAAKVNYGNKKLKEMLEKCLE